MDPYELDGLSAATEVLPGLAAAALVDATMSAPGWQEGRKVAGRAYAWVSEPASRPGEAKALGLSALLNRQNVLRVLDDYIHSLTELRKRIADDDSDGLRAILENARERRDKWWLQRLSDDYGALIEQPQIPSTGDMFGRMFGIHLKKKEKK